MDSTDGSPHSSTGEVVPRPAQVVLGVLANAAPSNYETVFTNSKAGMDKVDKDYVRRIVYEMSKDSPHFKNEQRKQAQATARIERMRARADALSKAELEGHTMKAAQARPLPCSSVALQTTWRMDAQMLALEATRDLTRTWCHVDMDAFFAAVEERAEPSLKLKPVAVGGVGMIATANYVARKFGVRSAMPGFIGRRLCPELVFVKPDFRKYSEACKATRAVFADFDPDFEAGSLDEAYLDVTDYCERHSVTGAQVAAAIRRRMREETQLTCSVGVGPNRLLAKVASDLNKPDGQYEVAREGQAVAQFIAELPIRKVPGIGKVTEQLLKALSIVKCNDIIQRRGMLAALLSPVAMDSLLSAALGLGRTQHGEELQEGQVGRKGIGCERTFAAISRRTDLEAKCAELAEKLSQDMVAEGLRARTLTLKLKATSFELRTRAVTLPQSIAASQDILAAALRLLKPELPIEIRLMGLRMSNFLESHREKGQSSLDGFVKKPAGMEAPGAAAGSPVLCEQDSAEAQQLGSLQEVELSLADWGEAAPEDAVPCSPGTSGDVPGGGEVAEDSAAAGVCPAQPGPGSAQAAAAPQAEERRAEPATASPQGGQASRQRPRLWACRLCTFAHNPQHLLRCEVCEQLRGSTLDSVLLPTPLPAPPAARPGDAGTVAQPSLTGQRATAPGQGRGTGRGRGGLSKQHHHHHHQQRLGHQRSLSQFLGESGAGAPPQRHSAAAEEVSDGSRDAPAGATDGAPSAWLRADAAAQRRQCGRCGQWVADSQCLEHDDYHMALSLQHAAQALCKRAKLSV